MFMIVSIGCPIQFTEFISFTSKLIIFLKVFLFVFLIFNLCLYDMKLCYCDI